jgi:hypothetical protein
MLSLLHQRKRGVSLFVVYYDLAVKRAIGRNEIAKREFGKLKGDIPVVS